MNARCQFTPQATEDLDAIWWFIAEENRDAADRVENDGRNLIHRPSKP
jgi:plasmid stabilization system protein ParE